MIVIVNTQQYSLTQERYAVGSRRESGVDYRLVHAETEE